MNKFFQTITNSRGDVLAGYRLQVATDAGAAVDIFADAGGTRFTDAGATVNYAVADSDGLAEFYWTPATGQVLQVLQINGDLYKSIDGFAENLLLDNLAGAIASSSVSGLDATLAGQDTAIAAAQTAIASRTLVKAVDPTLQPIVNLVDGEGTGAFEWDASVTVAQHSSDPSEGVFIAPDAAQNGAWRRSFGGAVFLEWFDGTGGTDYLAAWDAALVFAGENGTSIQLKAKTYAFTGDVVLNKSVSVFGVGGLSLLSISDGAFRIDASDAASNITGVAIRDFNVERTGSAIRSLVTTAVSGDTFTVLDHGLASGWEVVPTTTANGLTASQIYYSIRIDDNNFKVAASLVDADAGTAVALSGSANMTFGFYEVGAFEVIGDDRTTPQYALIRSKIDNIEIIGSTGNGFTFLGGGYQYDVGRIACTQATRRALFVDTGQGGNTAWNGVNITHLELRNGSQGRTSTSVFTERDSIIRTARNITISNLVLQGGAGFVIGRNCQAVVIETLYSELAKSPEHGTDIVIGEVGRAVPDGIKIITTRFADGSDAIGRSGKTNAIKAIRGYNLDFPHLLASGYGGSIIQNAYTAQSLVTGRFSKATTGVTCDKANLYFRPYQDKIYAKANWAGGTVTAGTTLQLFVFSNSLFVDGDIVSYGVNSSTVGLTYAVKTGSGTHSLYATAHSSADVTYGGRTSRISVRPLAFVDTGTDIEW